MTKTSPLQQLEAVHDGCWDADRGLLLVPPGTTPGLDLSALGLHTVRESALGAYLDLQRGRDERAVTALRNVVALQYDVPGRAWHGTFPVTAEQADPPEDAVEWFHYDPNWRQFLGTVLLVVLLDHGDRLPHDLVEDLWAAAVRAADGEPVDRIPEWYTNPNLLHAWLAAHAGRHVGDPARVAAGVDRARRSMDRLAAAGDVDEYNSPTYDGVDLIAAALWSAFPPTPEFVDWGEQLAAVLCRRLSTLFDPDLAVVCGPYSRAYGIGLDRYVSLLGLWLQRAGADRVMPAPLAAATDHVHDLFFLPLVERLAGLVPMPWDLRPVGGTRRHEQRIGDVTATSVLAPGRAIGWAAGPVPGFASDQYVPFIVHARDKLGDACFVGARPSPGCARVEVAEVGPDEFDVRVDQGGAGVRWTCSDPPEVSEGRLELGPVRVSWSGHTGQSVAEPTPGGVDVVVHGADVTYKVVVAAT